MRNSSGKIFLIKLKTSIGIPAYTKGQENSKEYTYVLVSKRVKLGKNCIGVEKLAGEKNSCWKKSRTSNYLDKSTFYKIC